MRPAWFDVECTLTWIALGYVVVVLGFMLLGQWFDDE